MRIPRGVTVTQRPLEAFSWFESKRGSHLYGLHALGAFNVPAGREILLVNGRTFTKDREKGGSGPKRRRLTILDVERVLAPRLGCGTPETPNRPALGGA